MAIDLRHLRFLVAVSESGSISAAARTLFMTQPAVTIALRNLERDVGVALLSRHRHGVDLTPAGAAFLAKAKLALEQIDDATATARQFAASAEGGELTIGLLPATFSPLPQALVRAFRVQHPQIRVTYRELSYIGHTRDLLDGYADIAFLWPPYDEPELRFHALSQEARVVGVAESHPMASSDATSLDELLDMRFPGFHRSSSGGWFAHWFVDDARGAPAATTADETTTPFEMGLVVQEGRAIAPAAESFANAFPVPGVRWLELSDAPLATLAVSWYPRNRNPARAAFIRMARVLTDPGMPLTALVAAPPADSSLSGDAPG